MSIGQVLFFTALTYEELSTVVMIGSLETFIAIFLSVAIFRLEIRPSVKAARCCRACLDRRVFGDILLERLQGRSGYGY